MGVTAHETGQNRAYKQINGKVYQFYSKSKIEAEIIQSGLEGKASLFNSLKPITMFSKCGRLVYLRVRCYKQTNIPTFQLQVLDDGKQKKTQNRLGKSFEVSWKKFLKLWRESLGLSVVDVLDYKDQILRAKRLYMSDVYNIEALG
jgi:hypothetical protein